jgi:hypothetical protein
MTNDGSIHLDLAGRSGAEGVVEEAIELSSVYEAANVEPYVRADGARIWSLMLLERQLRSEAYARRRGGYVDRRRTWPTMHRTDELVGRRAVSLVSGRATAYGVTRSQGPRL